MGQKVQHPRYCACPKRYSRRDLDLGANDVILALDGHISREEALSVAKAVLEGYGHTPRPFTDYNAKRAEKIYKFPGGEPRIGFAPRETETTHPFPELKAKLIRRRR